MKILELQNPEYLRICHEMNTSYGGDQNWFSTERWMSRDYQIHKWGCGVIAMGDLFLYLAKSNRMYATGAASLARISRTVLDWEDYKKYILYLYNTFASVMPGSGMNGFALASSVRRYCVKYQIPMTIAWKGFMDDQTMLRVIRKMLKENLPVVLSIGPNTPLVFRKKGIPFYVLSEKNEFILSGSQTVHQHFVMITGIVYLKHGKIMLKLSSWGKEYYLDYQEYRTYISEEGDTITSSLLYLSTTDGTLF